MDVITLEAKAREAGKAPARAARQAEEVPCVLYGHGEEPRAFQVPELALRDLIYTDKFHRVNVVIDGNTYDCVLKDYQMHPVTERVIHADFVVLHPDEKVKIKVPVHYEGTARGVRNGGVQQEFIHKIAIRCLPENLPESFKVDVTGLKIGERILVRDMENDGLEILAPQDSPLVSIRRPRQVIALDEDEEEEGEGGEGAEGGEAAEGEAPVEEAAE
ncbi:MAG: 50S ribosomal protein L25 [Bacteroidota bacterium]|nr:50S ribosomal protein L25 [Bacteroidota bacterium]